MSDQAGVSGVREAVLGEVMQDLGSPIGSDTGWFILGVDGYFDVDNACWCQHQEGDSPWDSRHFRLYGTVLSLIAEAEARGEQRVRERVEVVLNVHRCRCGQEPERDCPDHGDSAAVWLGAFIEKVRAALDGTTP
jgi:hypothetical protein